MIHGGDIYRNAGCLDFSSNINPLGTPEAVKQAMRDSLEQVGNYPDVCCEKLKEKLAAFHGIRTEQLICGNGAADLIFRYVAAAKPKQALVVSPCFAEYEQALCFAGAEIKHYRLELKTFCLDEGFLKALTKPLDAVFLCNPNNPTGKTIKQSLLLQIAKRCKEQEIRLFLDECFLDFLMDEEERSLIKYAFGKPHVFILRSFTKMYAVPGIRLGYGICADKALLSSMEAAGPPWNVSVLAQAAGIAALDEKDFVEETRCFIQREREFLENCLTRFGITFWEGSANYIFLYDTRDLKQELLGAGILIRDCSNYDGLSKGYYRIAVKDRDSNEKLAAALEKIESKRQGNDSGPEQLQDRRQRWQNQL